MCEYCTDEYLKRKHYVEKDPNSNYGGISWFIKDQFMGDTMPRVLEVTACNGIQHQSIIHVPIRCCPNCGRTLLHPWSEEYKAARNELWKGKENDC